MRPQVHTVTLSVDADGIAESQTPSGAGAVTIDGELASGGSVTLDNAHRIGIASDGDDSGVTFTVVGTDANGVALSETITGPNTTTVESTGYFLTITSITISGAGTGNITIGTVDEAITKTIPVTRRAQFEYHVAAVQSGAPNFDIQYTLSNVQDSSITPDWFVFSDFDGVTASASGGWDYPVEALRCVINSGDDTDSVTMTIIC